MPESIHDLHLQHLHLLSPSDTLPIHWFGVSEMTLSFRTVPSAFIVDFTFFFRIMLALCSSLITRPSYIYGLLPGLMKLRYFQLLFLGLCHSLCIIIEGASSSTIENESRSRHLYASQHLIIKKGAAKLFLELRPAPLLMSPNHFSTLERLFTRINRPWFTHGIFMMPLP